MLPDVDPVERDSDTEALWAAIRRLESRVRILEGRLSANAVTLSDKQGATKVVRLSDEGSLEVE